MSFFSDFTIAIFASERDWVGHGTAFGAACLVEYSEVGMEALDVSALLELNRSLDCHKFYKVPEVPWRGTKKGYSEPLEFALIPAQILVVTITFSMTRGSAS